MGKNDINIDSKREWQTYYDAKLVGRYLIWFYKTHPLEIDEHMIGVGIMPYIPSPSLEGFLMWVVHLNKSPKKHPKKEKHG